MRILLGILTVLTSIVLVFASIALEIANRIMRIIYENSSRKH